MRARLWMFTLLGVVFTIIGTITVLIWPNILHSMIAKQMFLSNSSQNYPQWKDSTMPMRMEVYLFHWTNPKLAKNGSLEEIPNLVEMGPYVFTEHRSKVIFGWNEENDTVSYFQNRTWFFESTLSNGTLDDYVTTLNVPALSTAYALRYESSFLTSLVNWAFKGIGIEISVTKTVREFVFEGYSNPIMDIAKFIPKKYMPVAIPFDKFGWFYTRNGSATYDGAFNMETGKHNIDLLGKLSKWNYENRTNYFSSYCGDVNGSAGELFGLDLETTQIDFYSPDICRPIVLQYSKVVSDSGISAYRFVGDPKMFFNKTSAPDNWCYAGMDPSNIHPNGVLNISSCKWGAPLFVSFPHFYQADPSYREAVIGMNPDPVKHEMVLDVQHLIGVPVHAAAGMQINVFMEPIEQFTFLKNMPKIFFPSIWFKEIADVSADTAAQIKSITILSGTPTVVGFTILAVGITSLIVVVIIYLAYRCRPEDEADYLISTNTCEDS